MNYRLGASSPAAWAVVALVFAPAIYSQAAWGLGGPYAKVGVVVIGVVLVALAGLLFSASLHLSARARPRTPARHLLCALTIGLVSTAATALAFAPLAVALRVSGMALPAIRYKLATFEQFLYAVALNPASGVGLLVLLPVAVAWAHRLQVRQAPLVEPTHANAA